MNCFYKISFAFAVAAFALFPLTDTDVWWHLASARNYLEHGLAQDDPFCWTPSRSPWINVHLYFQLALYGIYKMLGTGGLVLVKSFLWGIVAFLWVLPVQKRISFCTFSGRIRTARAFVLRFARDGAFDFYKALRRQNKSNQFWRLRHADYACGTPQSFALKRGGCVLRRTARESYTFFFVIFSGKPSLCRNKSRHGSV